MKRTILSGLTGLATSLAGFPVIKDGHFNGTNLILLLICLTIVIVLAEPKNTLE